jgi:hypothetical protein
MVKKKGNNMNSESKKYRIICEMSLNYENIAEIMVYEYLQNELISFDSDSSATESDSDDETDVLLVVIIPPDSSPRYNPSPSPFTKKVGIIAVV